MPPNSYLYKDPYFPANKILIGLKREIAFYEHCLATYEDPKELADISEALEELKKMSDNKLPEKPTQPFVGSRWKHFKGTEYIVVRLARDCEDPNRILVVYEDRFGETWIRERTNFMGIHENGQKRFTELLEQNNS